MHSKRSFRNQTTIHNPDNTYAPTYNATKDNHLLNSHVQLPITQPPAPSTARGNPRLFSRHDHAVMPMTDSDLNGTTPRPV